VTSWKSSNINGKKKNFFYSSFSEDDDDDDDDDDYYYYNYYYYYYYYYLFNNCATKWGLDARDILKFPLLAASSKMETTPMAGKATLIISGK